jgi:hypothetical protein
MSVMKNIKEFIPHAGVNELIIDRNMKHIVFLCLDQCARKGAIDQDSGWREAIWRNIGIDDVKIEILISSKSTGGKQNNGKKEESLGFLRIHFRTGNSSEPQSESWLEKGLRGCPLIYERGILIYAFVEKTMPNMTSVQDNLNG